MESPHCLRLLQGLALIGLVTSCGVGVAPTPDAALEQGARETTTFRGTTGGELFQIEVNSHPDPVPLNTPFHLEVHLFEADGVTPVTGARLEVEGWMKNHGHGMLRRSVTTELSGSPGIYEVRGMLFHMGGHWDLRIQVSRQRLTAEERLLERDGITFGVDL
ncbi:MAG: FixH family protein [Planctomycetota bacterium]|jgi:hypothetical protein|nr:hypothetical protein [Planctomycetota bacterium]MDP6368378.1 FixH family protein [Planctomycetota bacterium]MDP6519465.1 FixH family protein [Planctomycetota bacterium]MDP6837678.1 FixH family protein [Planctomycetota bacterium]MDP6954832.1 FixH family protein [Planctomycetota bacterium]